MSDRAYFSTGVVEAYNNVRNIINTLKGDCVSARDTFNSTYTELNSSWKGQDAYENLKLLKDVYDSFDKCLEGCFAVAHQLEDVMINYRDVIASNRGVIEEFAKDTYVFGKRTISAPEVSVENAIPAAQISSAASTFKTSVLDVFKTARTTIAREYGALFENWGSSYMATIRSQALENSIDFSNVVAKCEADLSDIVSDLDIIASNNQNNA